MEVLFYIAIAIIYLIIQVRAARKKQQQQQQTGASLPPEFRQEGARAQQEVSLEDALREIRQSLGMETPSSQTPSSPSSAPSARSVPSPREVTAPQEFQAPPSTFADADFESKPTAFGKLPSIHKHEQVPARQKVPARKQVPVPKVVPKSALEKKTFASLPRTTVQATIKAPEVKTRPEAALSSPDPNNLRNLLNDPKAAQKAFILGEVLGPPRAHRPH
ncbi:MAG TPA: hypothetical protein VKP65_10920 [Rhodothermales bacterium]|nr:hypothetical protein [Rhodothermales bacterium]